MGATFLPYGYVQRYRAKFGRKAAKREGTNCVRLTTKARQEKTQHVKSGTVIKSPTINKRGSAMINYACVSRKRGRVDAFV